MRTSIAAFALIRRPGPRAWLTQWNDHWQALNLIGGHVQPEETFHACCEREVAEELGLRRDEDFEVDATALGHVEFDAWSQRTQEQTHYVFEVFAAQLTQQALTIVE